MSAPTGARQYLQTQVQSRTPLELVVMLYDGAIGAADLARDATVAGNLPVRREGLSRLVAIVGQLQATLDMERGGQIAVDLDRLYKWIIVRLMDTMMRRDAKPIQDVRDVLATLREAWQIIAAQHLASQQP